MVSLTFQPGALLPLKTAANTAQHLHLTQEETQREESTAGRATGSVLSQLLFITHAQDSFSSADEALSICRIEKSVYIPVIFYSLYIALAKNFSKLLISDI